MATNDEFDKLKKKLQESAKIQAKLHSGVKDYLEVVRELGEVQYSLNHAKQQQIEYEKELKELNKELNNLKNKSVNLQGDEAINAKKQIAKLKGNIKAREEINNELKKSINHLGTVTDELGEQVKQTNKMALGFNSINKGLKQLPGLIKKGYGYLKTNGIFEMDKDLRNAAKSMNTLGGNFEGFSNNINTANKITGMWGVGTSQLAKAQQSYSEEIGRSVILNEEGLVAIGEIAAGTHLGAEGASSMVSQMDRFGVSAIGTKDIIEETVKIAAKMGVNSEKAIKSLQVNLKLSQRFNFKGGVKGLTTMANEAARLKIDMEGISGLAEKVFRPEGAVEMAAQLAVMGGEFAKLGDYNTLMYKARNDFGGFAKDIASATIEFIDFNKQTGESTLKGGLAADRMREIAKITGIQVEELQKMATEQMRIKTYGAMVSPSVSSKEDREMIASLAKIKNGEATIYINNEDVSLKDLNDAQVTLYKQEQKSLKERAEISQTFDEVFDNFVKTLKSTLLPIVQGLKKNLGEPIQQLIDNWRKEGLYEKMEKFTKGAIDVITWGGKWVVKLADLLGARGTLAAIIGGSLLVKASTWILNGRMLRLGFNSVGGGIGVPGTGGIGKKGMMSGMSPMTHGRNIGKYGKTGANILKGGKTLARGAGGLSIATASIDGVTNLMDDDLSVGEGLLKTLDQNKYMALGAAIGSIFPVVGTLAGAGIGGVADWVSTMGDGDGLIGDYGKKQINYSNVKPDVNDGVIKFNGNDKFMDVDENTMIAGTSVNGNKDLAKSINNNSIKHTGNERTIDLNSIDSIVSKLTKNNSNSVSTSKNSSSTSKMVHSFDEIKININFNSESTWLNKVGEDISKDRRFIRDISVKIQEEIRMAIGGGKLNPNPL